MGEVAAAYPTASWDGTPFKFEAWDPEGTPEYERQLASVISTGKLTFAERRALRGEKPNGDPLGKRKPTKAWDVAPEQRFWEREPHEQAYFSSLPRHVHCAEDFKTEEMAYRCRREIAVDNFRHIQQNVPYRVQSIVADLDRPDAVSALMSGEAPPPNIICENPENGHAHATWLLYEALWDYNPKWISKAVSIERAITRRLQGDMGFSMMGLCKNPLIGYWNTMWPAEKAYNLTELADFFTTKEMKPWSKKEKQTGFGRNVKVFDMLGEYARRICVNCKRKEWSFFEFHDHLKGQACYLNDTECAYPLGGREIRDIVKHVAEWTWRYFSEAGLQRWHSMKGKAAMKKRWDGHVSQAERAKVLGLSVSTLKRRLASPIAPIPPSPPDIVISSQESKSDLGTRKLKQWQLENIPRSTWFDRQAKLRAKATAVAA